MGAGAPILLITVGRTRPGPLAQLEAEFLERISPYATIERRVAKASRKTRPEDRRKEEAAAMRGCLPSRGIVVALDSRGRMLTSAEFGRVFTTWRERGPVGFLIGGPDGLEEELTAECAATISLSRLTFPHELALVMLMEQIYRALAGASGHPYSRH